MTHWYWVRHGPTHARGMVGWTDLPADLSDLDRIARLQAYLPDDAVVVASDLGRASATADAIQGGRVRLPDMFGLREMNFGEWEGQSAKDIQKSHPDLSRAFWTDPGDPAPPGGESWNAASARVARCVDQINTDYADRPVIAVAHMGIILMQIQRAAGLSAHGALGHVIDNLSVTEISHRFGTWQVLGINHDP